MLYFLVLGVFQICSVQSWDNRMMNYWFQMIKFWNIQLLTFIIFITAQPLCELWLKKVIVSQSNANQFQIWVYIAIWGYVFYQKSLPVVFYTLIAKIFRNWPKYLNKYILTCLVALFSCVGATENWKSVFLSISMADWAEW